MTLVRERYADFGPTLATEKLAECDGLRVSRETVRNWMAESGRLMQLRFVGSESAFTYFEALELYLQHHGAPIAFYSDKR